MFSPIIKAGIISKVLQGMAENKKQKRGVYNTMCDWKHKQWLFWKKKLVVKVLLRKHKNSKTRSKGSFTFSWQQL